MASRQPQSFGQLSAASLLADRSMTRTIRTLAIVAAAIAALAGSGRAARALDFRDIAGQWCGDVSSYVFARETLTVILRSDRSQRVYRIDSYQYDDAVVTVTWERGDDQLITEFGEFS